MTKITNMRGIIVGGEVYCHKNDLILWLFGVRDMPKLPDEQRKMVEAIIKDLLAAKSEETK